MANPSFWDEIRDIIRRLDLVLAAETLELWLEERLTSPQQVQIRTWLDEIILHTGSARAVELEARKGLISNEQKGVSLRQIASSILSLVNEVESAAGSLPSIEPLIADPAPLQGSSKRDHLAAINRAGEQLPSPLVAMPTALKQIDQAIMRVRTYCAEQNIVSPSAFISYAWGVSAHERWVEKRLAPDLQKSGVDILLDRWHNAQIGASVSRFVELIEKCDRILVVGTPAYRRKYENQDSSTGYVVAAEVDVISNRLLGTELQKRSVLPLLLDGDKVQSFPPLLHSRVFADFRDPLSYALTTFDLILSLYRLSPNHPAVVDLRESLRHQI